MAPDAEGAMRKIPEGARVEEGRALARAGDAGWSVGGRGRPRAPGASDDEVVEAAAADARARPGACRSRG